MHLRRITFPVQGTVSYFNDFGACRGTSCSRQHEGNDLMGHKLQKILAPRDGTVTFLRNDASSLSGNMLILKDDKGWSWLFIHLNNDTPGTDDGKNPQNKIFAPGIHVGSKVKAGQHIAYMGDSGNAESSSPHLHLEMHKPSGLEVNPYWSLRLSQGRSAGKWCAYPSNPAAHPSGASGRGYWILGSDGRIRAYGSVRSYGAPAHPSASLVGITATPSGRGYWLVDARGKVYPRGDARGYGDASSLALNQPMAGLYATPTGKGYWLFARDGGVFSFGDAKFYGSTGAMRLNAPVVGMAPRPHGGGYWLVASDGGVFSFGKARFHGSTGGIKLNKPVVSMVPHPVGGGYMLLALDGGTFAFGRVRFYGSLPGLGLCDTPEAAALTLTATGKGYWLLKRNGGIQPFGDAKGHGGLGGTSVNGVALAAA